MQKSENGFCTSFVCGDESENSLSSSEKVNIHSDRVKIHLILLKNGTPHSRYFSDDLGVSNFLLKHRTNVCYVERRIV